MPLPLGAHVIVWIAPGWIMASVVTLLFAVALCTAAKHADAIEEVERCLGPALDRLYYHHAPSGASFFAAPDAREQLLAELAELALVA